MSVWIDKILKWELMIWFYRWFFFIFDFWILIIAKAAKIFDFEFWLMQMLQNVWCFQFWITYIDLSERFMFLPVIDDICQIQNVYLDHDYLKYWPLEMITWCIDVSYGFAIFEWGECRITFGKGIQISDKNPKDDI